MNARELVTNRLAAQIRRFPDLDISPLDTAGLDDRDAALARAIEHAVVSRWLTLVRVIETQLTRPWVEVEARLQAVLLTGAAQLLLLDRLPDHAVINEAVEWAKSQIRPKAGGMVNAVLRKVAGLRAGEDKRFLTPFSRSQLPRGDGRTMLLNAEVFDADPAKRLAQQTSHPDWLITHWTRNFGQGAATEIALHGLVHPPIIINSMGMPIDEEHSKDLQPHEESGFYIFTGEHRALLDLLRSHEAIIVQDPTAAAPGLATRAMHPPPQVILDVCAGMGTKTRQLVALHPQSTIVCTDIDSQRLAVLREQFRGDDRVKVVEHRDLRQFDGKADVLLLDVPCSNSGVFARRVEAKYRLNKVSLQKLIDLQRQIVADSIPLLSPRGRIVYSTCSIDPAENDEQARWIAKWHPMKITASRTRLPTGIPGQPPGGYSDGGFFAVLERKGDD